MSDDNIDINVGMNPAEYLAGADQMIGSNSRLQQSMAGTVTSAAGIQRALQWVTPGRATLLGLGAMASAAANTQQNLSGLSATSAVTQISTEKLGKGIMALARSFPVGADGAGQVVEQFTKMGISGKGSEEQIGRLSKTVLELSGATGEAAGGLGQGMAQFARATGNNNLDPKRFENLADSLTRVSKTSGASAGDILAFGKNIAPMAQAAGIGATGVMGISASFARLGEDGLGAQTAINKMMTDMSRSVRDGGPEMKVYGEIVGTTATNFQKMFEADPTKALDSVVNSISKAGGQGPRMLEQLGLDGVRSMRSLQALSASGGISGAVAEAQKGYGSGATANAADAAFGGLNAQFTELQSSATAVAEAFGQPLLGPLTSFVKMLKVPVGLASTAAHSEIGQGLMKVIGTGALGLMAVKAIMGPLSMMGIGRQMATSSVSHAIQAGVSMGREDERPMGPGGKYTKEQLARGVDTRFGRAGEATLGEYERGTLGEGVMGNAKLRALDIGVGIGEQQKLIADAKKETIARQRTAAGESAASCSPQIYLLGAAAETGG